MEGDEFMCLAKEDNSHHRWHLPTLWMTNVVHAATTGKRPLMTEYAKFRLLEKILQVRGECGMLTMFDWVNIPLVYTQVCCVVLA